MNTAPEFTAHAGSPVLLAVWDLGGYYRHWSKWNSTGLFNQAVQAWLRIDAFSL